MVVISERNEILKAGWDDSLSQFSKSTGLVVSLYDSSYNRISGPHLPNPLSKKFAIAGLWSEDGRGTKEERELIHRTADEGQTVFATALDTLTIAAVPLKFRKGTIGFLVVGWMFDHFTDPVESDRLAGKIGIRPTELWLLIRQHNPVPKKKFSSFVELLTNMANSRVIEFGNRNNELKTGRILRILNRSALELTSANTLEDIEAAAVKASCELTLAKKAYLYLVADDGSVVEQASNNDARTAMLGMWSVRTSVEASDGTLLGIIEVFLDSKSDDERSEIVSQVNALSAQVAVAIQKVKLITDLQRERGHLKLTLEELRRASLVRDQFLATLSHELRTPLTAMLGWVQMLRAGAVDEANREMALETIESNAKAQAQLIEDLLDASRIISGKMSLQLQNTDLVTVIREAANTVRPAAAHKGLQIITDLPLESVEVTIDPIRLQQVFWNLLSNAVKFTPAEGLIRLKVSKDELGVTIEIADTGCGIAPTFLPFVFDRFSQADSSFARNYGGLGLGLAIVKQLVELHGGSIGVTSRGQNQGTTFLIRLPFKTLAQNILPDKPLAPAAPASAKFSKEETAIFKQKEKRLLGLRVLLVDDTPDSLNLMKIFAESQGAVVATAASADAGLAMVQEWKPDLLVSDISMPEKDGLQLIAELRESEPKDSRRLPAVAVTAYSRVEDKERVIAAGFDGHIAKPINPTQFVNTLFEMISPGSS